jgi:predicted GNAT family acetyltransferase
MQRTDASGDVRIVDNPDARRYEALVGDRVAGFVDYRPAGTRRLLIHTEVDSEFEGRGIGSQLARGVLDDIRARGMTATVHCPFITAYLERHPDYEDIVERREPRTPAG